MSDVVFTVLLLAWICVVGTVLAWILWDVWEWLGRRAGGGG